MTYYEHEARCKALEAALRISTPADGASGVLTMTLPREYGGTERG